MSALRSQTTLKGPCSISGRGFWSGKLNTLIFLPAAAGTGIRFVRDDLGGEGVEAVTENCQGLSLRTCLGIGVERFEMIEHVMATLAGLQIDNVRIHCTAAEIPGFDGSSFPIAAALQSVGKVHLRAARELLVVNEVLKVGGDDQWIKIEPSQRFEIEYRLDYGSNSPIRACNYHTEINEYNFLHNISAARTFVTHAEATQLQSRGLAQHVTYRDLLVFGEDGPIDNQTRFDDECPRHKLLDVLGDLAVTGVDLVGKVTASRSGHQLNAELAKKLRQLYLAKRSQSRAA